MEKNLKLSDDSVFKTFTDNGCSLDGYSDTDILLLLFDDIFGRTKYDNQKLAAQLLGRFGSVAGVIHAPARDLKKLGLLSFTDIIRLKEIGALHRFIMTERCKLPVRADDAGAVSSLLRSTYFEEREEKLLIFPVVKGRIVSCFMIDTGGVDSVRLSVRAIIEKLTVVEDCSQFIMSHNHPDGCSEPSEQDLISTGAVYSLLDAEGYKLLAHYIYTRNGISSVPLDKAHAAYFFQN